MAKQTYSQEPPVSPTAEGMKNARDTVENTQKDSTSPLTFPYANEKARLNDYGYYEQLFLGQHFEAFRIRIDNAAYGEVYNKLRYVKANLAGLMSKVVADMLFGEKISITVPEGDQDFVDGLVNENNLYTQLYESALTNSFMGDSLFKVRTGIRNPSRVGEPYSVIIEETTPVIYFPKIDQFNVRSIPQEAELAWTFRIADKKYLRKEIHKLGSIENKVYEMEGDKIKLELPPEQVKQMFPELELFIDTKVDESLLVHIPNWKAGNRYWGISDYYDLDAIFYAINNRLTKTDNILDKHSDPILAVPEGILDKDGKVKREALGMIEMPAGVGDEAKPEYIVWNANLEIAEKQINQLVEMFFMISETSPDILGMGKGQSDSGRALKYKLLRTIAKVNRKKLYYDRAIKEMIYTAQKLAKAWGITVDGKTMQGEPVRPEIDWQDGIPVDIGEQIENEQKAIDAGLTSKADAIGRVYGYDEETAQKKADEVKDEKAISLPQFDPSVSMNPFKKKDKKDEEVEE